MNSLFLLVLLILAFYPSTISTQQVNLTALGITQSNGVSYFSGYINLTSTSKYPARSLHYLFITSNTGQSLPLTIFIANNILPGTSVLIDAFYNSGPFIIKNPSSGQQSPELQFNQNSIAFLSNLLYIDVVSGVGYSTPQLFYNDDDQIVNDAYLAIKQWLSNPQYSYYNAHGINLMGNGYGGMIIPRVAQELIANKIPNFQGILIGNPTFNYDFNDDYNKSFWNMFEFLSNHNFIDEQSMSVMPICIQSGFEENSPLCVWLREKFNKNFGQGINLWDVYGTNCYNDNLIPEMYSCLPLAPLSALLTSNTTANALHVQPAAKGWNSFFNYIVQKQYQHEKQLNSTTTLQVLQNLLGKIKVWVYDSDSSAYNSIVNTRYYLSQLNLGDVTKNQYPYPFLQSTLLDIQVAGYITNYKNFVYATIKKGNYWAGQQQPLQYIAMFGNFLS